MTAELCCCKLAHPADSVGSGCVYKPGHGFEYSNTKTGQSESGDTRRVAMWMLDSDYDGRSLSPPRQVFFPMADETGGRARPARNLKAETDLKRIDAYRGTVSLSFEPGAHKHMVVTTASRT